MLNETQNEKINHNDLRNTMDSGNSKKRLLIIDDEDNMEIMRLFNEPEGQKLLAAKGVSKELIGKLELLGISSIANMMGCIKMAKYYEMNENDCLFTVATDSMEMYQSRMKEQAEMKGKFDNVAAAIAYKKSLMSLNTEYTMELTRLDQRRMHNLKYFTWIEQQGKTVEEINQQWDDDNYWDERFDCMEYWDDKIKQFNKDVGLLKD